MRLRSRDRDRGRAIDLNDDRRPFKFVFVRDVALPYVTGGFERAAGCRVGLVYARFDPLHAELRLRPLRHCSDCAGAELLPPRAPVEEADAYFSRACSTVDTV